MSVKTNNDFLLDKFKFSSKEFTLKEWVRNPSWLPMPTVLETEQKIVLLHRVDADSNYVAFIVSGDYTVDWGDGTVDNWAAGATALHEYSYSNPLLNGTNAPVTFVDSGDLVVRNNHGYTDGMAVTFNGITGTTGVVNGQVYYVVNATQNNFQVASVSGGSPLTLTNDGSGALLDYKQVFITISPQSGQILNQADFNVKHTRANLQTYSSGYLDAIISVPNANNSGSVKIGSENTTLIHAFLERCKILSLGWIVTTGFMFSKCYSLQSVPLFNTQNVTNMDSMFASCYSLQSVPLFNTQNVASMYYMFYSCRSLKSVPLFNTQNVTDMTYMFYWCYSLQSVPLFNTQNVANMRYMFYSCYSLQSVPLFNTQNVTDMRYMFYSCDSLKSVPLFNTQNVANMAYMFNGCVSLQSVPLFNTQNVTDMNYMFSGCNSLNIVPLFNMSKVANVGSMFRNCSALCSIPALNMQNIPSGSNFSNIFYGCGSLSNIDAYGFRFSFSVASCKLSGAALNKLYGNLATTTGQTITVSTNHGTPDDTPSIATAKGWTVTGS